MLMMDPSFHADTLSFTSLSIVTHGWRVSDERGTGKQKQQEGDCKSVTRCICGHIGNGKEEERVQCFVVWFANEPK
jgi:hypothetical protein